MKNRIAKGVQNLSVKTPALVLDAISNEKILPPSLQQIKWEQQHSASTAMPKAIKSEFAAQNEVIIWD